MILPKLAVSTVLFLLFTFLVEIRSENILTVSDTTVNPNQKFTTTISLTNSDSIIGFQFDLTVPNAISYQDSFITSSRFQDHQVVINRIDSTTLRALCFSPTNSVLTDTTGPLLQLLMKTKNITGQFFLSLDNALLVGINNYNVLDSVHNGLVVINPVVKLKSGIVTRNKAQIYIYPNPFNSNTTLKYHIKRIYSVKILLINQLGQVIKELIYKPEKRGWNTLSLKAPDLPSGFYVIRIITPEEVHQVKTIIVK